MMTRLVLLLLTLLLCVTAATDFHLRHRELRNEDITLCLDLGKQRGMHNMKVSKKKYVRKLARYKKAEKGFCSVPTKKLRKRLKHPHEFCKVWNRDHVTISAPEGLRKWMIKEVEATVGGCGVDEDSYIEIFE